ncbi:chromosome partition protein Smc isoform X2 [Patella vulgata]|uniref:chromosome partition protein Smc isoform X2 n=1 Tax=Patella vulgata TaxID=6465 RepID=UPI0024A9C223|nr:chromosome partition protein Smc isoform X2 [Patella vulgata]
MAFRNRDKELKARTSELEDIKAKYKTENEEKTKLQEKLDGLIVNQTESSRKLQSYVETNERLKVEVRRKTDEVEKLHRNVNILEDRVRNLEIKACEVEKAELTLESTKKLLDSSQNECRVKESEIRRMSSKLEETQNDLKFATTENKHLEAKLDDLKKQVRQELMKNELIEKGLDTIPRLQEELGEQKKRLEETEKELTDKTALLTASRQSIRHYIDRIREVEERVTESETLKQNLATAHHEIQTLKHLMRGKDVVMFQKLQAIEQAKCVLSRNVKNGDVTPDINQLKTSVDKLSKLIRADSCQEISEDDKTGSSFSRQKSTSFRSSFITNGHANSIDVNIKPFSSDNRSNKSKIQDHRRPVTAIVYPSVRPSTSTARNRTFHTSEFHSGISSDRHIFSRQGSNRFKESTSPRQCRFQDSSLASNSVDSENESCLSSSGPERGDRIQHDLNRITGKERDEILTGFINVGDRIKITVQPKQPKYGRKKFRPINYIGIVKYKGYLDKTTYDSRLMVGVKLDDSIGDTEGTVNGKSFMYTPLNQGKYFKIQDISSVFDKKTGSYISTEILMVQFANQYKQHQDKQQYDDSDDSDC